MPVNRARKRRAWHRAHRCRLRRTAPLPVPATRRRRVPHALAILEPQRIHASALRRIGIGGRRIREHYPFDVGIRHINIRAPVGRRAPTAHRPSVPPLPTRTCQSTAPFLSGSSACTRPDFCPAIQCPASHSAASPESAKRQNRNRDHPHPGSWCGPASGKPKCMPRHSHDHLARPKDLPGLHIDRHERVARARARFAVVIASGDIPPP